MGVRTVAETFQVGDEVDQLGEREAVTIVRHDGAAVGADKAGAADDDRVRVDSTKYSAGWWSPIPVSSGPTSPAPRSPRGKSGFTS
jgi:hypothetical protein